MLIFIFFYCIGNYAQYGTVKFKMKVTGEMADMLGPMMPNKMIIKFNGGNTRISMEGGLTASMLGDILYLEDKDESFMLKPKEKTALRMPKNSGTELDNIKPEITILGEETVNGYNCTKYKVIIKTEKEGAIDQIMWTTKDIQIPKPKRSTTGGSGAGLFLQEIEGYPVKIEQNLKREGINLTQIIELENYNFEPLDASLFKIPEDYKIKEFDPKMFGLGR